jgi:hypothetical protein
MLFRETRDKRPLCPIYLGTAADTMITYKLATCHLQDLCGEDGILSHADLIRNVLVPHWLWQTIECPKLFF